MKKISQLVGLAAIVTASYFTIMKVDDMKMSREYDQLYRRTLLLYGDKNSDKYISDEEQKQFNKAVFSCKDDDLNKEDLTYREKITKLEKYNEKKEQEYK